MAKKPTNIVMSALPRVLPEIRGLIENARQQAAVGANLAMVNLSVSRTRRTLEATGWRTSPPVGI
jgi:hypothetical protein